MYEEHIAIKLKDIISKDRSNGLDLVNIGDAEGKQIFKEMYAGVMGECEQLIGEIHRLESCRKRFIDDVAKMNGNSGKCETLQTRND